MLPSQLVAVIADPLLQKLLLLRPDEEAYVRVNNWMMAVLQDIRSGEADAHTVSEVLGLLQEYVIVSRVCEYASCSERLRINGFSETPASGIELLCRLLEGVERTRWERGDTRSLALHSTAGILKYGPVHNPAYSV